MWLSDQVRYDVTVEESLVGLEFRYLETACKIARPASILYMKDKDIGIDSGNFNIGATWPQQPNSLNWKCV